MNKSKTTSPAAAISVESLSLLDLVKRMPVSQLWSVLGAMAAVIAAVAVGAWTVRGYGMEHQRAETLQEVTSLKFQNETLRDKEALFFLHKLYVDSVIPLAFAPEDRPRDDSLTLERQYARKLRDWQRNNPEGKDPKKPRILQDHIKARVVFQDGTEWLIPRPVTQNPEFREK